jgi:hypothetical protein
MSVGGVLAHSKLGLGLYGALEPVIVRGVCILVCMLGLHSFLHVGTHGVRMLGVHIAASMRCRHT